MYDFLQAINIGPTFALWRTVLPQYILISGESVALVARRTNN